MIRRPPRSTPLYSSAASDVYKRQVLAARGVRLWADARGQGRSSAGCYTGCCQRLGPWRRDGEQVLLHTYSGVVSRRGSLGVSLGAGAWRPALVQIPWSRHASTRRYERITG